jgi:carotenoid cleavage dioxygenase-like enzyme
MLNHLSRREFASQLSASAATAALGMGGSSPAQAIETADVTWASEDPHLSGNYLPVRRETDANDLTVVSGRIPTDLSGAYMRNGPNPLFKPLFYAYPMDGDGMIHAVYFDNGRARYRNRFVQTRALAVERRAGRAVYGSFTHPVPIDPALIGPGDPPGPFKNGAFISVLRHGGHLLALDEASRCYEMTMDLDTVGEWKAGSDKPIRLGAHNRRHPVTGALFTLAYSVDDPTVEFHQIDASGNLAKTFWVALTAPTMIHDFVLTERHMVLLAGPAIFDAEAARSGKPFLQWQPARGTRIGIIALDGSSAKWLEADPFFVFHFGNGFERGDLIVIDYVRHDKLNLGYGAALDHNVPSLHRMTIDPKNGKISDDQIADMLVEFPRINDNLGALATRYVYVPTLTDTLRLASPPSATFNTMLKVNADTGAIVRHDFGNRIAGEATFIPRGTSGAEDDGYLAIFAYDPDAKTSDLVLLDAAKVDSDPVAVVRLPQRVPQGLHGTWIPKGST